MLEAVKRGGGDPPAERAGFKRVHTARAGFSLEKQEHTADKAAAEIRRGLLLCGGSEG